MGCSCKNKAMRNTMPRPGFARPVVGSVASTGNTTVTPAQIRANAAALANSTPSAERNPAGMNAERRLIEKRRRDAIHNALGK